MLRIILIIVFVIVFALGVTIGFYNGQPVRFSYIVGELQLPLIALIVGEFAIAVLLTLLVVVGRIWSLKLEIRRLRKQLRDQEAELKNLRALCAAAPAVPSAPLVLPPPLPAHV